MSATKLGTRFALCAGLGLIFAACGSAPAEETAGGAGSSVPLVDNFPGNAGRSSGDGFKGWSSPAAGSGGAAAGARASSGSGGSAGAAGAAGNLAAGSGGSSGAAGAAGNPAADSGTTTAPPDPFDVFGLGSGGAPAEDPLDIFDPANAAPDAVSCVGLICTELADCQDLYPTEHAACKFTQCVDLECK
jgi:hypothetical protein